MGFRILDSWHLFHRHKLLKMISAVFYIFCESGLDEFTLEGFCPWTGVNLPQ